MIRISQIRLACGHDAAALDKKVHKILQRLAGNGRTLHSHSKENPEAYSYRISHHSVDARKKPELFDVYTVDVHTGLSPEQEQRLLSKHKIKNVQYVERKPYCFPDSGSVSLQHRPVVIGTGPAGLFCALKLAQHGYRPIVFERGKPVDERRADVELYWAGGALDPESNIQFGEGGAGTFSDGKLGTMIRDRSGRIPEILRIFVEAGAPEEILYEQNPHIGTDRLQSVIPALRQTIQEYGGEIYFNTRLEHLITDHGHLKALRFRTRDGSERTVETELCVLALGHSARDTITNLFHEELVMEPKNFAVGFRVSHPQALINQSQYGLSDPEEMERLHLSPANYKLTTRTSSGRGVYSFCMCPGGYIVNSSSEEGRVCVNGMSEYDRGSERANSAIVMSVDPRDFGGDHPLDGMEFQRRLEEKAFQLGNGRIPVERYTDFAAGSSPELLEEAAGSDLCLKSNLCLKGQYQTADLRTLFPESMNRDFIEGMQAFDRKIHGFAGPEAFLAGVEGRTSSPVRIVRDESCQASIRGVYPCGEGAGYAGGITSAAADGLRVAEAIARAYKPFCETNP